MALSSSLPTATDSQSSAGQQLSDEENEVFRTPPCSSPSEPEYSPAAQQLQWELKAALEWPPPLSPVSEYSPAAHQLQWELQQVLESLPAPSPPRIPRRSPASQQVSPETNPAQSSLPPVPPPVPPEISTEQLQWREARRAQLGEVPLLRPTVFNGNPSAPQLPQKTLPIPTQSTEQQQLRKTKKARLGTPPLLAPSVFSDDPAARQLLQEYSQAQNSPPSPKSRPGVRSPIPTARHHLRKPHRVRNALSPPSALINSHNQESDDSTFINVASIFADVGHSTNDLAGPPLFQGQSRIRALLESSSSLSSRPCVHPVTQVQGDGKSSASQSLHTINPALPTERALSGGSVSEKPTQQTAPSRTSDQPEAPNAANAVSTQTAQAESTARESLPSFKRERPSRSHSEMPETQPSTRLQLPSNADTRNSSCPPPDIRASSSHSNRPSSGNRHADARLFVPSTPLVKQEEYDPLYDDDPNVITRRLPLRNEGPSQTRPHINDNGQNIVPSPLPPRVKDPSQIQQNNTNHRNVLHNKDSIGTRQPALSTLPIKQEYDPLYEDDDPNVVPQQFPPLQPQVEDMLQGQQNNARSAQNVALPGRQARGQPPPLARQQCTRDEDLNLARQNDTNDSQNVAPPEPLPQPPQSPARDQQTSTGQRRSRRLKGQPPESGLLPPSPKKRRRQ